MAFGATLVALLTVGLVKVAVMVLAARLLLRVYGAAHGSPSKRLWLLLPAGDLPGVRILWWALVLFAVSELTCGVETYVLFRSSEIIGAVHAFSSSSGMGLFALGLYDLLDRRFLRFGGPGCVGDGICPVCTAGTAEGCRYRVLLLLAITFLALSTLPPFFAPTDRVFAKPLLYVLPFDSLNEWFDGTIVPLIRMVQPDYDPAGPAFSIPPSTLVIEYRILPGIALALAVAGIVLARAGREATATRVAVFAAGVLAFSYFDLVLYRVTGDLILGSLGHEVGEFWFLVAAAELLRRSFPPGPERPLTDQAGARDPPP